MRIYVNGCSHTFGDDLLSPKTTAWPVLVAKKLNAVLFNDAASGGTNERTIYRTIKNIKEFDLFIIAWTHTERFTRYDPSNNFEINFNPMLRHDLYKNNKNFNMYGTLHYKYFFNELYSFKLWLQQIIMLQAVLKENNKQVVMLNSCPQNINSWCVDAAQFNDEVKGLTCFDKMDDAKLQAEHHEISSLLSQINFNDFIKWGEWCITDLMKSYSVGKTGHLMEDGHQEIARIFLEYYDNKN